MEIETVDSAEFERIFPAPNGSQKKNNIPVPLPTGNPNPAPLTAYTPYNQSEG
jgi:hypothetical protein